MNWSNKDTVKKGTFGEEIAKKYLEKKGFVVYVPITETAHGFDSLAVKNKKTIIVVEVKSKACRKYYPDTGINIKHYNEYKYISDRHSLPVWLFFIDESLGEIYGNTLFELSIHREIVHHNKLIVYPLRQGMLIYFPLICMKKIADLKEDEIGILKSLSTRNYEY